MTTVHHEGLEVLESGRALKVQTEAPHLVSMGGGRLSTAVTLHPLPEGRVSIGSSSEADIMVQGTGVESTHCYIENSNGVVTLYPLSEMISLDGLRVSTPTRLTQGCMICIGRSNYMRFNHPAEARLMKSILPNTRISMLPLSLYNGDQNDRSGHTLDRKPPLAPRKSQRDSWGEVSNSSSCNSSSEECCLLGKVTKNQGICLRHFSPKVFPPGSATVNSPASVVLGHSRTPSIIPNSSPAYQNINILSASNGIQPKSRSVTPTSNLMVRSSPVHTSASAVMNGQASRSQNSTPTPKAIHRLPLGTSRSVTSSPAFDRPINDGLIESSPALNLSPNLNLNRQRNAPSPAFNRNPPPYTVGIRSITPTPVRPADGIVMNHRRTLSAGHDRDLVSPTPSYGSNCSIHELNVRKEELEHRHKQAQVERLREQETEKQERARLEEILSMCAEYERQNKPPTTPTIQQNRIKTNGSLPRDKRLASPGIFTTNDEKPPDIFTFESNMSNLSPVPLAQSPPSSNTSTPASNSTSSTIGRSPYENVVVTSPGSVTYPQSPRTRIKTIATSTPKELSSRGMSDASNSSSNDYELVNLQFLSEQSMAITENQNKSNFSSAVLNDLPKKPVERDKFILPLEEHGRDTVDGAKEHIRFNGVRETSNVLKNSSGEKNILKHEHDDLQVPLVNGVVQTKYDKHRVKKKTLGDESEQLRKERGKLLATMSGLKRKISDIEQQEEELLRELDMERALLDGEWTAENDKLMQEQERLEFLQTRILDLDEEMENCQAEDLQRQAECKKRIEIAEEEISKLEKEVDVCDDADWQRDLTERLKHHFDIVDAEKKIFEDLEFRQLEDEADFLAKREELQREVSELTAKSQFRQMRLRELESQLVEASRAAQQESREMERLLIGYLRRLEESRGRLRVIEARLQEIAGHSIISSQDSSPDGASETDEVNILQRMNKSTKQSQDDLDRITRVTSGAPMEVCSGSLGRKTLESLKEIERNRQLHLAEKGSLVIEEERKRVEELKRRVQDEVRAQWEERRQREANCNSFNSIGSEESSLTSSDMHTESASSDDALEKRASTSANSTAVNIADTNGNVDPSSTQEETHEIREKELALARDNEETRPLSDSSSYDQHLPIKMRNKVSKTQRPLTRYLPIRSESLNLRSHIETAGHQVELCPHVNLDSSSCRGFLHKMGSKFHNWNKRWFVFDRSKRTFVYYSDRTEKKPRGGTYFQSIEEVYVDHLNSVKSPNPQLTFVVKTSERSYHLMAPSPEAMRIWVDVIFTGAEGYQEFEHGS